MTDVLHVAAYIRQYIENEIEYMKTYRILLTLFIYIAAALSVSAQERTVENRPYCDLRPMHFGVVVGTNLQGMSLDCLPRVYYTDVDGVEQSDAITAEQDRWDNGFHVGVLGEFRLSDYAALRVAPTLYFGNRHFTFQNMTVRDAQDRPTKVRQDMKTVAIASSFDLIYAAKRFNNHRPYVMAGVCPMLNLATKSNDFLQLKRSDVFFEVGMGCDFYLPFFKLRPELKFMHSFGNSLNKNHPNTLKSPDKTKYAMAVTDAASSIVALTFYFE